MFETIDVFIVYGCMTEIEMEILHSMEKINRYDVMTTCLSIKRLIELRRKTMFDRNAYITTTVAIAMVDTHKHQKSMDFLLFTTNVNVR